MRDRTRKLAESATFSTQVARLRILKRRLETKSGAGEQLLYGGFVPGGFRVDDHAVQVTYQSLQPERLSLLDHALRLALQRVVTVVKAAAARSACPSSGVVYPQKGIHAF